MHGNTNDKQIDLRVYPYAFLFTRFCDIYEVIYISWIL